MLPRKRASRDAVADVHRHVLLELGLLRVGEHLVEHLPDLRRSERVGLQRHQPAVDSA
jgi:hypothetical protein